MPHATARALRRGLVIAVTAAGLAACGGPPADDAPTPPPPATPTPTLGYLAVTPAAATLISGATGALAAVATFDDGTTADVTARVTWQSSDPHVASIGVTGGAATLYANEPGTVTISATLGDVIGLARVTVTAALRSIVVSSGSARIAPCGAHQYVAIGSFSDGTQRDVTALADWSTSDAAVAVADPSARGLVDAVGPGDVVVAASWAGARGELAVVADPTVPKELALSPSNLSVVAGQSVAFTTTATFCDGTSADATMTATWSSSAPAVATIDDVEAGAHIANTAAPGTTWIAARLGELSDAIRLDVQAPALQTIFVSTPTLDTTVALGSTTQLAATGSYDDGSSADLTATVTWSSSDPSIALVSSAGVVAALACGQVTISAAQDGQVGSLAVDVTQ